MWRNNVFDIYQPFKLCTGNASMADEEIGANANNDWLFKLWQQLIKLSVFDSKQKYLGRILFIANLVKERIWNCF